MSPLAQALVEKGFRYPDLVEIVEEALIQAARGAGDRSDSEVQRRTGLPATRLKQLRGRRPAVVALRLPYLAGVRLISRWLLDPDYSEAGVAKELPLRGDKSFAMLARLIGIDPTTALRELKRTGAVRVTRGRVGLQTDAYVPSAGVIEKLDILGRDGAEFLRVMIHNVRSAPGKAMLQRKASYDNIGAASLSDLRAALRREGQQTLQTANRFLAAADLDRNRSAPKGKRTRVSFGVYCFEEPVTARGRVGQGRIKHRRRKS